MGETVNKVCQRECHYISLKLRTVVSFPSFSESCIWCRGVFFLPC